VIAPSAGGRGAGLRVLLVALCACGVKAPPRPPEPTPARPERSAARPGGAESKAPAPGKKP
jgi:hypothetical protein